MAAIYFSDVFEVSPDLLEEYGAFNISLINDLPLFIDPFLLFNSEDSKYKELHDSIIDYMRFLKDISANRSLSESIIHQWFAFPEVRQNWLGFSQMGNRGRGLGSGFAKALYRNLNTVFSDFGQETITQSSHIEKLCLIRNGVGRDMISDFTANLVKGYLCEFTQEFARNHLSNSKRAVYSVDHVRFNYKTFSWANERFELPILDTDYVLLTPKEMLTRDETWINRPDLIDSFRGIADALPNSVLRAQVNEYLIRVLPQGARPNKQEVNAAISNAIERFPQILDYYILKKEENGDQAVSAAKTQVNFVQGWLVQQVSAFVEQYLVPAGFYELGDNTYEDAKQRLLFLKDVIENKGGHRLFYVNGEPIKREEDLQILYRLTWFASVSDVNREVNDGRGPADYQVSRGPKDKTLVEFKLAKNTQLERNLKNQTEIYERASNATHPTLKAILYFHDQEFRRVQSILERLNMETSPHIILIDAGMDNKPSGSRA